MPPRELFPYPALSAGSAHRASSADSSRLPSTALPVCFSPPVLCLCQPRLAQGYGTHRLLHRMLFPSSLPGSVPFPTWSPSPPPGRTLWFPRLAWMPLLWGFSLLVIHHGTKVTGGHDTAACLTRRGVTSGLKSHLLYLCILQVQNPEQSKRGVREG